MILAIHRAKSSAQCQSTASSSSLCQADENATLLDWDAIQDNYNRPAPDSTCSGRLFGIVDMTFYGGAEGFFGKTDVKFSLRYCLSGDSRVASFSFSQSLSAEIERFLEDQWKIVWKSLLGKVQGGTPIDLGADMLHPGRVCGNYCGPFWCGGQSISQSSCLSQNLFAQVAPENGSCADSCCMAHDQCCSGADRRECNKKLINCLQSTCAVGNFGTCENVVYSAMLPIQDLCCGGSC